MSHKAERRESTRVPIRLRAEVYAGDTRVQSEKTRDLGMGGVYLPTARRLPLGTHCRVVLLLEGPSSDLEIQVDGQVVRVDPSGMAIAFTAMSVDSFHHLRSVISLERADADAIRREMTREIASRPGNSG